MSAQYEAILQEFIMLLRAQVVVLDKPVTVISA